MEYLKILEAIKEYENMSSEEIQNNIKPIIKSYNTDFLSEHIGVSKENLYRICKKGFVEKQQRVQFTIYIKIMALGKNPNYVEKTHKPKQIKRTPEERKEALKIYQQRYYQEVTKKKRQEKKERNHKSI